MSSKKAMRAQPVPVETHPVLRRTCIRNAAIPAYGVGVHGRVYDVRRLAAIHPGGRAWIRIVAGTDASSLFELSHLNGEKADALLSTLDPIGFYSPAWRVDFSRYRRLKAEVLPLFPTRRSRVRSSLSDFYASLCLAIGMHCLLLCAGSPLSAWWAAATVLSALANSVLGGYGHNFLHQLHPAALGLDWNGLSAFEWLLEHVVSHHPRPNTLDDHDSISMSPFVAWMEKSWRNVSILPLFFVGEIVVALQGNFGHRCRWRSKEYGMPAWMQFGPFLFWVRIGTHVLVQGVLEGLATAAACLAAASFYFSLLAHLNHTIDPPADCTDAFFLQTCATADIAKSKSLPAQLVLGLDRQVAHHLFPTLDHSCLPHLSASIQKWAAPAAVHPLPLSDLVMKMMHRLLPSFFDAHSGAEPEVLHSQSCNGKACLSLK